MKRICIVLAFVLVLGLVGCGGSAAPSSTATLPAGSVASEPAESVSISAGAPESEYYFRDGVLVSEDVRIEITDWKVIPAGEKGNEYGEVPVIAFWFDITNLSGKESITPMSWIAMFTAIQDNDPNKVNELGVGMAPDSDLVGDQMAEIKEGGTLAGAIAYELDDETTPVTLKATRGLMGEELGEQTFEIA